MYDVLVIGKGLFGSAATRYLSQEGLQTGVLGPDEPDDYARHEGVFASHYDQGRITRRLGADPVWSTLARRSLAQYQAITAASGIPFYTPAGCLYVAAPGGADDYLARVAETALATGVPTIPLDGAETARFFPFLRFPAAAQGIYEAAPAGFLHPRALIRAQLAIAAQHEATIIRETAVRVTPDATGVTITTLTGNTYRAQRILIAAGAFTNSYDLLPRSLDLRVKTETILLAEVGGDELARLAVMPCVLYELEHPDLEDIYLTPPIRYPDGRYYLKLGCNTSADSWPADLAEMQAWMTAGDSDRMLPAMREALLSFMPGLRVRSWQTRRCLVTYTAHRRPYIDALVPGRVYVAAGGNGRGAKSSDAIGHLAADLVQNGRWQDELEQEIFAALASR